MNFKRVKWCLLNIPFGYTTFKEGSNNLFLRDIKTAVNIKKINIISGSLYYRFPSPMEKIFELDVN